MLHAHKFFFLLFLIIVISFEIKSEEDPYLFIDSNAQKMANVLTNESELFETDRLMYEDKIKEIFEPMIDFRRVAASVMGKKYYLMASTDQRADFVLIFKDSLLDTYAETLAQWGESTISTQFPPKNIDASIINIEVRQTLDTGNSKYPISYDEDIELTLKNWVSDAGDAGIS